LLSQIQALIVQLQDQGEILRVSQANTQNESEANARLLRELEFQQQFVVQLREAILCQQFTESLLRQLYPGDSVLHAMMERDRALATENSTMKGQVTQNEAALQQASARVSTLEGALQALQSDMQQTQMELQLARSATMFDEAATARHQMTLKLEEALRTISELQMERDQLKKHEAALEQRVADLAADPVSYNVRTYGVERTRSIAVQMEELHARCTHTQQALSAKTEELDAAQRKIDEMSATAIEQQRVYAELNSALEASKREHQRLIVEFEQLQVDRCSVQNRLDAAMRDLTSSTKRTTSLEEERDAIAVNLENVKSTLTTTVQDKETLFRDNLELVQRMTEVNENMLQLGKELHAAQKAVVVANAAAAAAARRTPVIAEARNDRGRKAASSFQEAISGRVRL